MKPSKPLYLKTYGKQKRKLSAWISPENRKQAFDSSVSTDGDVSVFEPATTTRLRERKTSVASRRAERSAKKKAILHLLEENSPSTSCPQPAQQSKRTREKRTSVASRSAARTARKRATLRLKKTSSDEENIRRPSPPCSPPAQQSKTTSVHLLSAGRFVTRRRCAVATKPKLSEATLNILDSSDHGKILQPSRSAWVPPAENLVNAAGTTSFATNCLREISLNELADLSLRKPIFCSTPSAGSLSKRSSSSEEAKSHIEEIKNMNIGEIINLSTDDSNSSCQFVSAVGGLEWLIEALKEKCLTEYCTVQLKRLSSLPVTQLCSQTTYSSCLGLSGSVHSRQANEHPLSVDSNQMVDLPQSSEQSFNLHLSVTNNKTSDNLQSPEHAASVTDSESANTAPSVDCKQSEAGLACDEKSENDHAHDIDPEDFACSGEITGKIMACVRQSIHNRGSGARTQSDDPETEEQAGAEVNCLPDKLIVKVKRLTPSQLKEILQLKDTKLKSHTDVSDSASDDQKKNDHQSESDTDYNEHTSVMKVNTEKSGSTSSEDKIASDKGVVKNFCDVPHKRKKPFLAPKEKKRTSTSVDLPGTTRKACVSGLSVNRWKDQCIAITHTFRSRTAQKGSNKTSDCSINELISTQHKQPTELLRTNMDFSTPVRAGRPPLLSDFTPNTHTWSRLKAALSVHRKSIVLLTPRSSASFRRAALADLSQDLFATPCRTPLPKRLQSQLLSYDSLVACEDADLSDADKVFAECGQQRPLTWEECILPERMKQCVKIGEGTFGEVFSTTNASGDTVALKIIPLEGSEKVNGEDQKSFGEILHEIIISKELSSLKDKQQNQTHGFIGLNDLHCVQGCYPPDFMRAWDTFDQQKGSENDRPDFFENNQLFLILEFEFGGIDLENSSGTLSSLWVAKSILHQVTAALAVAEQELHFEHRDLHWGNVLVKTTKQKTGSFLLNGAAHSLETKGVLVRIIDYSLSRLEIDDLTVSCDISMDEELFMGRGDYQFDIYRLMRQENGNNWSNYHPHTNVLWLHYLCSKLLSMKYRGFGGRGAKDTREELTRFYGNVLQYSSATEALQNCPMFQ